MDGRPAGVRFLQVPILYCQRGDLEHRLTGEIHRLFASAAEKDMLKSFPSTLAFLSAVDATVSTRAVITDLFMKLAPGRHELVVFDLNRGRGIDHLFRDDPGIAIEHLLTDDSLLFDFSVIGNAAKDRDEVVLRRKTVRGSSLEKAELGLKWPPYTYSLSHVALPFLPDDTLYGGTTAKDSPGVALGQLALRGERGVLAVSAVEMLRQRWNPFYGYIESRSEDFLFGATRP